MTAGILAMLSGPIQFSSRLRQRSPRVHRVLGRVYVFSVFTAVFFVFLMLLHLRLSVPTIIANLIQSSCWFLSTLAAFLTARNRHIVQHRQWMVRSYAVTFTFILIRLPNAFPFWTHLGDTLYAIRIILLTLLAVFIPDFVFNWQELRSRRA